MPGAATLQRPANDIKSLCKFNCHIGPFAIRLARIGLSRTGCEKGRARAVRAHNSPFSSRKPYGGECPGLLTPEPPELRTLSRRNFLRRSILLSVCRTLKPCQAILCPSLEWEEATPKGLVAEAQRLFRRDHRIDQHPCCQTELASPDPSGARVRGRLDMC
jgi:hypothetical protein